METLELRAVERILAVLIGGLCIYLGYRLFGAVPEQTNGEGRISFAAHASVYVNRVGRYVAAHSPTERASFQTADIARRLLHGSELHQLP